MRKLAALLVLLLLAAGVWLGARYVAHRGELKATIVFHSAGALRKGDRVVEGQSVIGRVTQVSHLDGEDAVSVRLDRDHRRAIVSDSLFAIDGHDLIVTNTFAVGTPVEDGAVLKAREDKVTSWLAKHAAAVAPLVEKIKRAADERLDDVDADHIDAALDRWKDEVPEWKKEGSDAVDKKVDAISKRVKQIEADLSRSNRAGEARALKEKFQRWLDEVRR